GGEGGGAADQARGGRAPRAELPRHPALLAASRARTARLARARAAADRGRGAAPARRAVAAPADAAPPASPRRAGARADAGLDRADPRGGRDLARVRALGPGAAGLSRGAALGLTRRHPVLSQRRTRPSRRGRDLAGA